MVSFLYIFASIFLLNSALSYPLPPFSPPHYNAHAPYHHMLSAKIYDGRDASPGVKARTVRLDIRQTKGGTSVPCTGSIIGVREILTAAHCVMSKGDPVYSVRVWTSKQVLWAEAVFVKTLFFDGDTFQISRGSDMAILKVGKDLKDGEKFELSYDPSFRGGEGNQLSIAGWGQTKSFIIPTALQEDNIYNAARDCPLDWVKYGSFCTVSGKANSVACGGDSGGPVFVESAGMYVQVGIHSGSFKDVACGEPTMHREVDVWTYYSILKRCIYENVCPDFTLFELNRS